MSKKLYRVPLDFDWPLNEVWEGFLLPERLQQLNCPDCTNGLTPAGEWLESLVCLLMMLPEETPERVAADPGRIRRLHPWLASLEHRPGKLPSGDIAELTGGLAGRPPRIGPFGGHDALDNWAARKAIVKAAGLDPDVWGCCPTCDGHAYVEAYAGQRAEAEAWQHYGPPEGEGWQLWETDSEGSPVTPVFATAEGLVDHLVEQQGYRRSAAEQIVADGEGVVLHSDRDADVLAQMSGREPNSNE